MTDGPLLWYLNRSTGIILLGLLTLATALGILATAGRAGRWMPGFVSQALHRNISLLALGFLAGHVVTAVADTFVDIRWWQALVPVVGSTYEPWWLGLGTLSLDLLLVVVLSSVLRRRLPGRAWRAVHQLAYLAWGMAVLHGIGIGTDLTRLDSWATRFTVGCVALVGVSVVWRLLGVVRARSSRTPAQVS